MNGVNRTLVSLLSVAAVLVGGAALKAGPAQGTQQPGQPTQGRVWIENRGSAEAVPVSVQTTPSDPPFRVQVTGNPAVTFATGTVLSTHAVRQEWEYRQVSVAVGQDLAAALGGAGNDGWEAVGLTAAAASGTVVLLKRPK